jgi:hypothetical protein
MRTDTCSRGSTFTGPAVPGFLGEGFEDAPAGLDPAFDAVGFLVVGTSRGQNRSSPWPLGLAVLVPAVGLVLDHLML